MLSPSLSLAIVFILRLAALCINAVPAEGALTRLGDATESCGEDAVTELALGILHCRILLPIYPNVDSGVLERVPLRTVTELDRIISGVNEEALVLPFKEFLGLLFWPNVAIESLYLK